MPKFKFILAITAIVLLSWSIIQTGLLRADDHDPLYIVIVDRHATSASQQNKDLTVSFIGLLSALREDQSIGFLTTGEEEAIGPAVSGSAAHKTAYKEIATKIEDSSSEPASDLSTYLSHAHELMKFEGAGEGSTVYVVSGGDLDGSAPAEASPLGETISAFNKEDWQVVSISLPGSSTYAKDFMRTVSSGTGSDVFQLSTPQELKVVADNILSVDAKGTLFEIGQDELAPSDVFTASLEIAPSTTESSLVFFKQGATGSLSLRNPSGVEASEGDRALSNVIETPHLVIWTLINPVPGEWTIDVRGGDGFISAWHYPKNKLDLHLVSSDVVPFDQNTELVAYIEDEDIHIRVPDAEVRATIIDASGQTLTYTLNDNGEYGDAIAGDAYYSTTLPSLGAEGDYTVEIDLHWPQYQHSISTRQSITAQAFPIIDIDLTHTEALEPGERVIIGTAEVKVNGQPYAIPTDRISAQISSQSDASAIEIVPQELLNTGRAWAFNIIFTPAEEELHTLLLHLNMEYASRDYNYTSNSEVLSSFAPTPPAPQQLAVVQQAPQPAPAAPAPQPPAVALSVSAPESEETSDFPVMIALISVAAAISLLAIAAVIYAIYGLTRTQPYGYLYDDYGNPLADFSSIERPFLTMVTSKNLVHGKELGIPELFGISFYFSQNKVEIRSAQSEPCIRVNNLPLLSGEGQNAYGDVRIGTQGKLFNLHLVKPEEAPMPFTAPMTGDD